MTALGSGAIAVEFGRSAGAWTGRNGFRLMPTDELHDAPAGATVSTAADGHALVVTYIWVHPVDGPQDGVLIVGSPEDGHDDVTAAWGDSWHQKPALMTLRGRLLEHRVEVGADYGGGWQWTISLDGSRDDRLVLTMDNVVPADQATADVLAGPYPVMVTELGRPAE